MSAREQRAFAAASAGRACIACVPAGDGRILTRTWRDWLARWCSPLRWALASFVPVLFSGCAESRAPVPGRPAPTGCGVPEKKFRGHDRDGMIVLGFVGPLEKSKPRRE